MLEDNDTIIVTNLMKSHSILSCCHTYREEVNIEPFKLPKVEQATKMGIIQDIKPSVLLPNV